MDPKSTKNDELELKNLVLGNQCVAFVGAGLSIPPGPAWRGLVKNITDECGIVFDDSLSLTQLIDSCIAKDEVKCTRALRQHFPTHVAACRTAIGFIHRLNFKAIITTNFDPWLWLQSTQSQYKKGTFRYPNLPLHDALDGGIYFLHGYLDAEDPKASVKDLVFGEESFAHAYGQSLLPGFLLNIFTYRSILFIGFNPTEQHMANLLTMSTVVRRSIVASGGIPTNMPKRFILWPMPQGKMPDERVREETVISTIRSLEVTPVLYDPRQPDHRGLDALLHSWVQEGDLKNRSAPFRTGFEPVS